MNEREFIEKLDGFLAEKNGDLWLKFLEGETESKAFISALEKSGAARAEIEFAQIVAKTDAAFSDAASAICEEFNIESLQHQAAPITAREIAELILGKRKRGIALDENTLMGLLCGIMCVSLIALGGFFQSSAFSYSATACAAVYAGLVYFKRQTSSAMLRQL